MDMDFSAARHNVNRSQLFRTPFSAERELGLWVDRIGEGQSRHPAGISLRVLGLYGAVVIERGAGVFTSGSTGRVSVRKGDVMLLFPDVPHSYQPDTEWYTRWIVWSGSEAAALHRKGFLSESFALIQGHGDVFGRAFAELLPIMEREDLEAVLLRKTVVLRMLCGFHRAKGCRHNDHLCDSRIQMAAAYMQEHFDEQLSIQSLARQFGMSETHFRRRFRQHTGRSPTRFMISHRISAAKRLLAAGLSIKKTAASVGIEDEFYFMRLFRKEVGLPPGRFASEAGRSAG